MIKQLKDSFKKPVLWYQLYVLVLSVLIGLMLYFAGYNRGWEDGSQFVIQKLKEKIDQLAPSKPPPLQPSKKTPQSKEVRNV